MDMHAVSRGRKAAKSCMSQQTLVAQANDENSGLDNPPTKRRYLIAVQPPPLTSRDLHRALGVRRLLSSGSKLRENHGNPKITQGTRRRGVMSFHDPPSPVLGSVYVRVDDDSYHPREDDDSSGDEMLEYGVAHTNPRKRPRQEQPRRFARASGSRSNTKLRKTSSSQTSDQLTSDLLPTGNGHNTRVTETARAKIHREIAETTTNHRNAFLLAKQDYFTPLLPSGNYIVKLQRKAGLHSAPPEIIQYADLDTQPENVRAVMKPYQLQGLAFLLYMHRNGMSAILGDEMGLGKTLQTLSLFQYLTDHEPSTGENQPFLVICPLSVLSSWLNEAQKWVPNLNVVRFHGSKGERQALKADYGIDAGFSKKVDIFVTTYETFVVEEHWFKRAFVWRYCVLDEGHKIKNDKTMVSTTLQGINSAHRLLLTGTPLQNNLTEMWGLLHWLYPDVFVANTADNFKRAFDLSKGKVSTGFIDSARSLLELIMLRRLKCSTGVDLNLPPKHEVLLYIPLTPMQRFWYKRLLTRVDNGLLQDIFKDAVTKEATDDDSKTALDQIAEAFENQSDAWAESKGIIEQAVRNEKIDKSSPQWRKLMNLLIQLRKVCSHPYILPHAGPEPYFYGQHIKTASGKFIVLDKLIDELVVKQKKKIIIFSQYTMTLDLVEDLMVLKGCTNTAGSVPFRYERFDGSTPRARRNLGIRTFNDLKDDTMIMLISTKAGGLGINLTAATDVVFMDEDWNPQVTLQAEARAHRIGQTKTVTVYKLCTQGTVEEQMLGRIYKKLYLSTKITESMRNIHHQTGSNKRKHDELEMSLNEDGAPQLDANSLMSLVRRGTQTLAKEETDITEMLSWDWETIITKCKDQAVDTRSTLEGKTDSELERQWLSSMEKVETTVFEGKKHSKKEDEWTDFDDPVNRAVRRQNKNTTVMVGGYAISKESMNCAPWEAVPTMAGKNPRLAEPAKVKKAAVTNQGHCQVCREATEGGTYSIINCRGCPRAYHAACLSTEFETKARAIGGFRSCPQHECAECKSKADTAGGMIYRCRWCERGFCEDCLDWDTAVILGPTLAEFEMLNFGEIKQAYYIECPLCIERFIRYPVDAQSKDAEIKAIEEEYEEFIAESASPEPDISIAKGTSTGVSTPATYSEAPTPRYGSAQVFTNKKGPMSSLKQTQIEDWDDKDEIALATRKS